MLSNPKTILRAAGSILFAALIVLLVISYFLIDKLKYEKERLEMNQELLFQEQNDILDTYRTDDSLNAAKIGQLRLTLEEYKRYRENDLKLIATLRMKKRDLERVVSVQSQTIMRLQSSLYDSIIYDTIGIPIDTTKCFDYHSRWFNASGCIAEDIIDLTVHSEERLKIVETVVHKRFLGFLWRTKKVKSRQVDVVSENPLTVITGVEYIAIER